MGVWVTCLAPGWPQLRSGLPFGPRSQASLQKAQHGVRPIRLLCPWFIQEWGLSKPQTNVRSDGVLAGTLRARAMF